jgi:hypothetical protein
VERKALRPDLPRELVLDHGDVSRLSTRVDALFRHWFDPAQKAPLGREGIELLERVLANSFELRAPLAYELADEEQELLHLTEGQYRVLDMLARHTRVAIAGCAGSGKTFLAAEKARRLAEQGFKVLVVVFNVLLGEHLRRGLADQPEITVRVFHGLCREVAEAAGVEFPKPEPGGEGAYYGALETAFAEHADVMAGRFDALIVDEGQDVSADWWLPLQILLADPDRSPLFVLFDDNQKERREVALGEEAGVLAIPLGPHTRTSPRGHVPILRRSTEHLAVGSNKQAPSKRGGGARDLPW